MNKKKDPFIFNDNPGLSKHNNMSEDKIKSLVNHQLRANINKQLIDNANRLPGEKPQPTPKGKNKK